MQAVVIQKLLKGRDPRRTAHLWVAVHGGGGRPTAELRPGVAFHHICRILLETCASARAAADLLLSLPHLTSYRYFIADNREMYVVETHPERTRVREPEGGMLACTNHPVHPEMTGLTDSPILENSRRRLEALMHGARRAVGAADPERVLKGVMQDHEIPVCGHTDGLATFWSALCIPGRRQVAYSLGARR